MIISKALKKILFGKKKYQKFFRRLFDISLEGMNIGVGGREVNKSGEDYALRYVLGNENRPVIFDVGAQGGNYTNNVIEITESKCTIYAFEPCPKDYEHLSSIINNSNVHLIKSALGERDGQATLYFPSNKSGLSSLLKNNDPLLISENVKIETLDTFCRNNQIGYISLLKLDTEGYELSCLMGAKNMLPNIKNIQFEMSIGSRDARVYFIDIFQYLKDYKIYRILKDGLFEIRSPERITELLFTTNYLACRIK